jgi:hypothetical protein
MNDGLINDNYDALYRLSTTRVRTSKLTGPAFIRPRNTKNGGYMGAHAEAMGRADA